MFTAIIWQLHYLRKACYQQNIGSMSHNAGSNHSRCNMDIWIYTRTYRAVLALCQWYVGYGPLSNNVDNDAINIFFWSWECDNSILNGVIVVLIQLIQHDDNIRRGPSMNQKENSVKRAPAVGSKGTITNLKKWVSNNNIICGHKKRSVCRYEFFIS